METGREKAEEALAHVQRVVLGKKKQIEEILPGNVFCNLLLADELGKVRILARG